MTVEEVIITYSEHCCDLLLDGYRLDVKIYKTNKDPSWILEVINEYGTSTVWDEPFNSDGDALRVFEDTVDEEGISAFLTALEQTHTLH